MNHDEYEGLARALFEATSEAQFLIDPETGQILDANAAAQRLCGISLRTVLKTPINDLFQVGDRGKWIEFPMSEWSIDLPYAEGGCLLHSRSRASIPVDISISRLIVSPRAVTLLRVHEAGIGRLSSHPQVERSRLRHLLSTVPAGLWCAEIAIPGEGQFNYLSPSVQQIAGRPVEYFADQLQRWRDVIDPQDQAKWDDALEQRRSGSATEIEYRLVWPDKSVRWVRDQVRIARALTGSTWLYGVFTDATRQKQAEGPLHRSATLIDTAGDAIIVETMDGRIVDWNRGAERLYGYTKDEMQDKPALQLFDPDCVQDYVTAVSRLQRGGRNEPCVTGQVGKDGRRFTVSMRVSPIGGGAGRPDEISIIARCIPEQNRLSPSRAGAGDLQEPVL